MDPWRPAPSVRRSAEDSVVLVLKIKQKRKKTDFLNDFVYYLFVFFFKNYYLCINLSIRLSRLLVWKS